MTSRIPLIFLAILSGACFVLSETEGSIRAIDFEQYLMPRALEAEELCGTTGQDVLKIWDIEYADLDGDKKEEAIVEAQTCAMGQGGSDITEVYKLTKMGLITLPIDRKNEKLIIPAEYERAGSRSYRLDVRKGVLVTWYPVYRAGQGRSGPQLVWSVTYKWNGKAFIPSQVNIVPEKEFHGR